MCVCVYVHDSICIQAFQQVVLIKLQNVFSYYRMCSHAIECVMYRHSNKCS